MENKALQQILAPYDESPVTGTVIQHAIQLARIFKSGISLLRVIPMNKSDEAKEKQDELRRRLALTALEISEKTNIPCTAYLFEGKIETVINKIYESLSAIMVVAGLNSSEYKGKSYFTTSRLTSDYRNLRIPVLIVRNHPSENLWSRMVVPLDFNREAKEKGAWASYFGKRNGSFIHLVVRDYKDPYFAASLRNNVAMVRRLYDSLELRYDQHTEGKVKKSSDSIGLEIAIQKGGHPLLLMASREVAVDDLMFGLPEKKIINSSGDVPVLLINPRDDLYVPCS